jgi:hypothetical protein
LNSFSFTEETAFLGNSAEQFFPSTFRNSHTLTSLLLALVLSSGTPPLSFFRFNHRFELADALFHIILQIFYAFAFLSPSELGTFVLFFVPLRPPLASFRYTFFLGFTPFLTSSTLIRITKHAFLLYGTIPLIIPTLF